MIEEIDPSELMCIWKKYLWPNRESPIRLHSSMRLEGGFNMSVYQKYKVTCYGFIEDNQIKGINSCHRSDDNVLRSRGLFVFPRFRGNNIGVKLLHHLDAVANLETCHTIWSFPKKQALNTYLEAGFKQISDFENAENGVNCYVAKYL